MLLPYGAAMVAYMLSDRLEARARSGYPLSWLGVTCFSTTRPRWTGWGRDGAGGRDGDVG